MAKYNSKSVRLVATLDEDIRRGRFDISAQLPSEHRLAADYAVSRSTIRRALAELVERGVLEHVPNCGVKPVPQAMQGRAATAFDTGRTAELPQRRKTRFSVAWCFAAVPDALILNVTEGIRRYAAERQLHLQVINSIQGHEPVLRSMAQSINLGFDGIITFPYRMPEYIETLGQLSAMGLPIVTITPVDGVNVSSVSGDDFSGAFESAHRLLEKYDRPVYFIGTEENSTSLLRRDAFCLAMREAGFAAELESHLLELPMLGLKPEYWPMEAKWSHPGQSIEQYIIDRIELPASVVCENDYIAYGLYQAAARRGLTVGKDLFVCGFDDIPMARRMKPPLSTVGVDSVEIGYHAARVLHQKMAGEVTDEVHLRIPTRYIERESC